MFCEHCGNKIEDGHKFCTKCGKTIVLEVTTKIPPKINIRLKSYFLFIKGKINLKKIVRPIFFLIILLACVVLGVVIFLYAQSKFGVNYTKNPTRKDVPLESVVKIIVNKGTDQEASGSGILFTDDGYILTNAHVVVSPLGNNIDSIKVCYSTDNNQGVKCDYDAKIINADRGYDLAVIKVDRKIQEIKPYYFKVQEDDEIGCKEIVPLGSEIKAVGFPGVGDNSITITKGIISGYKNKEAYFNDGSLQKMPYYIKTDTEINHGNSGGAVFDKSNRYIGISESMRQDEGGKISYIIYWNQINFYLDQLVFKGLIKLPNSQFIKRNVPTLEKDLWAGINSYNADNTTDAENLLESYVATKKSDSRAWNYLCDIYNTKKEYGKLDQCVQSTRGTVAEALSWYYQSIYDSDYKKDNTKALESINKSINIDSEFPLLLNKKADIEMKLGKYDEAKKTADKILEIDDFDSDGLMKAGVLAEKNYDTDSAISYYKASFDSNPDPKSSSKLGELYKSRYTASENSDDLYSALEYNVATLVLDKENIDSLINLSGSMTNMFMNDNQNTWGESLNIMKKILNSLEINKDLISSIGNVSDDKIIAYLKEENQEEPTAGSIKEMQYFIKTTKAWLYTFADDKVDCFNSFKDLNIDNPYMFALIFSDLDYDTQKIILNRSLILSCFCENTDYSNDTISSCYRKKLDN